MVMNPSVPQSSWLGEQLADKRKSGVFINSFKKSSRVFRISFKMWGFMLFFLLVRFHKFILSIVNSWSTKKATYWSLFFIYLSPFWAEKLRYVNAENSFCIWLRPWTNSISIIQLCDYFNPIIWNDWVWKESIHDISIIHILHNSVNRWLEK